MLEFFNKFKVLQDENLSKHCTMRVGGNAKYYIEPIDSEQFVEIVKNCIKYKIKYFVLGNGSNVIFRDNGFNGIVICTKKLQDIKTKNNMIIADCGTNLYVFNKFAQENGLGGSEWSYGIPGTIGGAVCMNAGAYGGQMQDIVLKVKVFDGKKTKILYNNELQMGYRDSIIKREKYIVLKVWLKLKKDDKQKIKAKQIEYLNRRRLSQPLETYNSGSIFKKVNDISAGKIIDNLGLKGVKINGAQISKLHANFIINLGSAKSNEIENLIELIKQKVKDKLSISLEEEVIFIGEE